MSPALRTVAKGVTVGAPTISLTSNQMVRLAIARGPSQNARTREEPCLEWPRVVGTQMLMDKPSLKRDHSRKANLRGYKQEWFTIRTIIA